MPPSPTEVLASLNFYQTRNLPLRFRDLELGKLHLKREVGQGTGVPLQGLPWPRLHGQCGVLPSGSLRPLSLKDSHTPFRNSEYAHMWGAARPRAQHVSRRARRHQVRGSLGLVAEAGLRSGGAQSCIAVLYLACDPSPSRQPGPWSARGFGHRGPSLRRAEQGL